MTDASTVVDASSDAPAADDGPSDEDVAAARQRVEDKRAALRARKLGASSTVAADERAAKMKRLADEEARLDAQLAAGNPLPPVPAKADDADKANADQADADQPPDQPPADPAPVKGSAKSKDIK